MCCRCCDALSLLLTLASKRCFGKRELPTARLCEHVMLATRLREHVLPAARLREHVLPAARLREHVLPAARSREHDVHQLGRYGHDSADVVVRRESRYALVGKRSSGQIVI